MALVFKDRVRVATTTTGTGTLTLGSTITGYQAFSAIGDGNTCYFCIEAIDANGIPTGDWEVSLGTYTSAGTTLSRTTTYASSNSGSAVNLSAGTKHVFVVSPAKVFSALIPGDVATNYAALDGLTVKGADIASATTTDIGAATGESVTITGTTTITGLGTKAAGVIRFVTFSGALTLTHNATSLILLTGANITTVAGDTAIFLSLGSGNWKCLNYSTAKHFCTVYNSAAINVATATVVVATFDSEVSDLAGLHSTSSNTSRITIIRTGFYLLNAYMIYSTSTIGIRQIGFKKNGAYTDMPVLIFPNPGGGQVQVTLTSVLPLNAGDYVELYAYQESGSTLTIGASGTTASLAFSVLEQ